MAEAQTVIVVSGAPELKRVPQHFWRRFAEFLRDDKSGQVVFHVNRGRPAVLDANERVRAEES